MRAKLGTIGIFIGILMLLALPLAYAQAPSACADGTAYGQCSSKTPGMYCGYDSSVGGSSLENVVGVSTFPKCQCSNFPGYATSGTSCVKTTCTDPNGTTVQNGLCASAMPKRCQSGQLVDDPATCGCPSGQQASPDGKACVTSTGCRWNNPSCPANNDCIFVASNAADPGFCKPKQGCAFGTVTCTDSQTCDTSTNANGVCKTKAGCQYLNPTCSKGTVCNPATGACETAPSTGAGSDSTLGGGSAASSGSAAATSGAGPLSCCCLPTAAATGLVGLALLRRKDENEE